MARTSLALQRMVLPGTLLIDYDNPASFNLVQKVGTPVVTQNTTEFLEGSSSIKVELDNTENQQIKLTGLSLDLSSYRSVTMWYYAHGNMPATANCDIWLITDVSGIVNYFIYTQQTATNITFNTQIGKGWNAWTIDLSDFNTVGSPDISDIRQIVIRVAQATSAITLSLDSLYATQYSRPKLCFVFDDANESDNSEAYDYMFTTNGIVGTSAIPSSLVGGGSQISLAQAQAMKADGWCFVNHSDDATELDGVSTSAAITKLNTCRNYIAANGLDTDGSKSMVVYPGGKYTSDLIDSMEVNGYTFGRIATQKNGPNQFITHPSDTSAQSINPRLCSILAELNATFVLGTFQAQLDDLCKYGGTGFIMCHKIVAAGATGIETDRADFRAAVDEAISRQNDLLLDIVTVEQALTTPRRS